MGNRVVVSLGADDQISPQLRKLLGNFKGLEQAIDATNGKARKLHLDLDKLSGAKVGSNLESSLPSSSGKLSGLTQGWATFWGGLGVQAVTGAIDLAMQGIGKIKDGLLSAASLQTQGIASSSDIAQTLGVNMATARGIFEDTQTKIADVAAALPGMTSDYNAVFGAIGGTLGQQFRGDAQGFKDAAMEVTQRVGVLAAIRKVSGEEAGMAANRLLAGTMGWGEARQLDLFQKNPMLQMAMQQQAAQSGVALKNWQKLSQDTRYQIFTRALKVAAPDSLLKEFEGTAEALMQTFQTNMFDPIKGAFGFLRKIDGRTALDGFTGLLQALGALGSKVSQLAQKAGISVDPMRLLLSVFDWLADQATAATLFLSTAKGFKVSDLGSAVGTISAKLQNWFNGGLLDLVSSVNWGQLGYDVTIFMVKAFEGFVVNMDWGQAIAILLTVGWGAVEVLGGALRALLDLLGADLLRLHNGIYPQVLRVMTAIGDSLTWAVQGVWGYIKDLMDRVSQIIQQTFAILTNPASLITGGSSPGTASTGLGSLADSVTGGLSQPLGSPNTPGNTTGVFAPQTTVNAKTGASPEAIASNIGAVIAAQYEQYLNGTLAPVAP
jgi:hypothetical protein